MGKELPTSTRDRQISEPSTVLRHNVDIVTDKNSTSLLPPSSGLIVKWMKNLSSSHQMRHLVRHAGHLYMKHLFRRFMMLLWRFDRMRFGLRAGAKSSLVSLL